MVRYATIDIGTNSVLLLVAERKPDSTFQPVAEEAEITRLGRGVDATGRLSAEGMEDTLKVLVSFVRRARSMGAREVLVTATSAARDAANGDDFLQAAKERAEVEVEIISGELEAQLAYSAAYADFGRIPPGGPLVVIDIGGGSTEFIYGRPDGSPEISFHASLNVGSVRLTERFVQSDPVSEAERQRIAEEVRRAFGKLPHPPSGARAVGVAGTVTTLYAIRHAIEPYEAARVHGGTLSAVELKDLSRMLCGTPLAQRRRLPGLQPKRADVICAGALILEHALERLGMDRCLVSDRGVRWGLLMQRFGATT
jgi:exopolyphosphatase/guanosine-5'-triphosphate,3'-diphosphate pyrophosphatase